MGIRICCLLATLAASPVPQQIAARTDALSTAEADLLIARNEALADVSQLCVALVVDGVDPRASDLETERLEAQTIERLKAAGIEHVDCQTGVTPRLQVQIETIWLKDCNSCVYRVQTALSRIVTFADHRPLQVRADVWRLKPVMRAVPEPDLAAAVAEATLTQVGAFAGAHEAARRLQTNAADIGEGPAVVSAGARQDTANAVSSDAGQALYVASRNSSVFHHADCRMAANISERNLVGYGGREDAVQAGKRPCKTCNP